MKTYQLIVSGRVQGVGYRMYAKSIADSLKLKGSVKNLNNGDVEIVTRTEKSVLEEFIKQLSRPQHSYMRIENIEKKEIESDSNFSAFKILY